MASALEEKSVLYKVDTNRLVQLSLIALTTDFLGSPKVGPTSFLDSYFVFLDMTGLLQQRSH